MLAVAVVAYVYSSTRERRYLAAAGQSLELQQKVYQAQVLKEIGRAHRFLILWITKDCRYYYQFFPVFLPDAMTLVSLWCLAKIFPSAFL